MTKKALTIGINYVNSPESSLRGCINDTENIAQVLIEKYGYLNENIVRLRDDDPNAMPIRNNILYCLNKLVDESSQLEELWIHYSGHGSQVPDVSIYRNDEIDGLDEVIVPADYKSVGFITDNEIFAIIKNVKCKTILIFDSCHSGTICDLQWSFEFNGTAFVKTLNVNKTIANPYVFCFSGCKDAQTSIDGYSAELHESVGVFTDAFIHCLKLNNYTVNILTLYAEIYTYVKQKGFSQNPMLSCSSVIPDYYFIPPVSGSPPVPVPEVVVEAVPDVVPEVVVEAVPDAVPEVVVEAVPDVVPEVVQEVVVETVPDVVPDVVPEVVVPEVVQEVVVEAVPEVVIPPPVKIQTPPFAMWGSGGRPRPSKIGQMF